MKNVVGILITVISMLCSTMPALAESCSRDFYAIELRDEGPVANKIDINTVLQSGGRKAYKALADANEQKRNQYLVDNDISSAHKALLISWFDWNIRTARCWSAVAQ